MPGSAASEWTGARSHDSRLGHGSVFTVVVMLKSAAGDALASDGPSQAADANAVRLDGTRILVVDDNRIKRKLLSIWLGEAGAEGLRAASTERFDAILMDVSMPVMNGLEATRAIRLLASSSHEQQRLRAMVPLVGVTAMAGPEERKRYLEAGMDAHLSKPLSRSKLLRTLVELMATQAWLKNDGPGPGRSKATIPMS